MTISSSHPRYERLFRRAAIGSPEPGLQQSSLLAVERERIKNFQWGSVQTISISETGHQFPACTCSFEGSG